MWVLALEAAEGRTIGLARWIARNERGKLLRCFVSLEKELVCLGKGVEIDIWVRYGCATLCWGQHSAKCAARNGQYSFIRS
jgi:hypothetical protein